MGGRFAAGGGDPVGRGRLDIARGVERGLVAGRLVSDERMCVGVASGGNKIVCEISGILGFLERKTGVSASPSELASENDDRTAWLVFVGEKGLMGRS